MESVVTQSLTSGCYYYSRRGVSLASWYCGLGLGLLFAFLALTAAPALAAPSWGIEMTHQNAYGAEGTVDPHTGSATTFARESGDNTYTIKVTNTGTEAAGGTRAGDTFSCAGGPSSGVSLAYQWLRNGAVISGATGSTYTLKAGAPPTGDEGTAVQCEVTASDGEGATVAISPSSLVAPSPAVLPPAEGRAEAFTFGRKVGETVSCETYPFNGSTGWTGSPESYEFQWLRNGVAISGASSGSTSATSFEYTLTPADAGEAVQCEVTATNAGGSAAAVSGAGESAAVAAPPTNTAPPTLTPSGTVSVGETLTCSEDVLGWEGSPTSYKFQWLRNGVAISSSEGGTASTYTLKGGAPPTGDEGAAIQCEVTAVNAEGATGAVSAQDVVSPSSTPPPTNTAAPEFYGPVVGSGECYSPGSWEEAPTSYEYQLLRNGVPIAGANSGEVSSSDTTFDFTYTLTAADAGKAIQCEVTATNVGGSVVALSTATVVAPALPEPSATIVSAPSVSVADQLPGGVVLAGLGETGVCSTGGKVCQMEYNPAVWQCTRSTLTCTTAQPLEPGQSYEPIRLHVYVDPQTPLGTATDVAAVYGGGAPRAEASDATTITPAVPFGIQTFTTSVVGSLGEPFAQGGGHPFAASTQIVFNTTTSSTEPGRLDNAGGDPKDLEVELPPGFVGDPQAVAKCPASELPSPEVGLESGCPSDTAVGFVNVATNGYTIAKGPVFGFHQRVYNLEPSPGHPAEFGFNLTPSPQAPIIMYGAVRSDGDYGITVGDSALANQPAPVAIDLTFCESGVTGAEPSFECAPVSAGSTPFLTNPTRCTGQAPVTTARASSYEDPANYVSKTVYTGLHLSGGEPSPGESFVTGCNQLQFNPEVAFKPSVASEGGTTQADEPTGATFALKVPQTNEAGVNATPELKNATVTFPEGMTVNPSAADGLEACSNAQFGLGSTVEPAEPAACPLASQVGTVTVTTPLLEKPLEGQVFLGEPECSPCSATDAEDGHIVRLFLQVHSAERGVIVKLAGHVSANPTTGRLQATFTQQPQLPFSELLLTLNGGARAPLANPQTCGTFTTSTDLTPWSAPGLGGLSGTEALAGTPDATPSGSFNVDWNGAGGACPGSLPFSPSFTAGSQTPTAGVSSPFSVTFGREDREQDISAITLSTPPGLLGMVSHVSQCPEAQANVGTCGAESLIGSTTVGAGPGPYPFYLGGKVYLTGPYKGAPFGLSIVVPAVAGPFNLGTVVVRASIAVNPATAALTITSDALPQFVDGVQLRLRRINVEVNRPGFMLNPTSCAQQAVRATITAAQGASSTLSTPFEVGACQSLPFAPKLTASAGGQASRADGASLDVKIESAGVGQANIAKVDLQLPTALPSRLSTLQKACLAAVFNANPAACHEESVIGKATIHTPILKAPLTGPAYLVSHGGAAFPDVEFVLQGEGVTLILDGNTDIKNGITYSRFESAPDAPFTSFETELPTGPHSILGAYVPASANYNLCGTSLAMPTIITAQNGKQIKQTTKIAVTGCKASKPSVKITKTKLKGNTLLVTVKTSAGGTVKISGNDFKTTTKKNVNAGSHQIKLALSNAGKTAKKHRKKTKLRASLTVGKQAVANTISVKL